TLSCAYSGKVGPEPAKLKPFVDQANAADKSLAFAATHPLGTHAMLLRYWLGVGGIHPDVDVSMTTVPPPAMVAGLRREYLDGLCVGEPWNGLAVSEHVGFTAITSQEIWRDHPEKVCAVTEAFAAENPRTVKALCRALHEASVWLDEPANRPAAARILSAAHYVNAPADVIEGRLCGRVIYGDGRERDFGDGGMTFSRRNANYPQLKHVIWWLTQVRRWGMAEGPIEYEKIARRVARFDLYEQAMREAGYTGFAEDRGVEVLFDGHGFDPADPEAYARSFRVNTLTNEPASAVENA
ncbi:MAG TPA: CmpA/NrtA family ABC transporter substrate-binding protein, partial [Tepidisphaeraceae bacterium]